MDKKAGPGKKLIFRKDEPKNFENFQDQLLKNSEATKADLFWSKYANVMLYLVLALILAPFIYFTTKSFTDLGYLLGISSTELMPPRWKKIALMLASAACSYGFFFWIYRIYQWKTSEMEPPMSYLQMSLSASFFLILALIAGFMCFGITNKKVKN